MNVSEAANRVIDLAGKVRDYYDTELPKRYPNYPLVDLADIETKDVPPPPEEKELRDFLTALPSETIYQLLLIMHFGHGGFGPKDLAANYESLKETIGDADEAVAEMMDLDATLAGELADGLEELRKHNINADKMPLKKVKVRKH